MINRDELRKVLESAIGTQTYDCHRIWDYAWESKTIGKNDFRNLIYNKQHMDEIIDAIIKYLNSATRMFTLENIRAHDNPRELVEQVTGFKWEKDPKYNQSYIFHKESVGILAIYQENWGWRIWQNVDDFKNQLAPRIDSVTGGIYEASLAILEELICGPILLPPGAPGWPIKEN